MGGVIVSKRIVVNHGFRTENINLFKGLAAGNGIRLKFLNVTECDFLYIRIRGTGGIYFLNRIGAVRI